MPYVSEILSVPRLDSVQAGLFQPGSSLPLIIQPAVKSLSSVDWATSQQPLINVYLRRHGGLLFRNFDINTVTDFEQFSKAIAGELLEYKERSSPRTQVSGNVYTSTDYPADQSIFLHNENSYQRIFPLKIFFYCAKPADHGGETPIADCRKILKRIDPEIRQGFVEKDWMYVRNFGDGFGLPWQTVFQTTKREEVEEQCSRKGIKIEWKDDNRLRISTVLPAMARHPHTREWSWFNHATFFHVSTLEPTLRDVLMEEFAEDELPTNTYYGDGSPIGASQLESLRKAYMQELISFPWQKGDVLLLDNMLAAHGRAPYKGQREVLVVMAEATSRDACL